MSVVFLLNEEKLEPNMKSFGIPEEKVKHAVMMLYKNSKCKVRSPEGDTEA